MLHIRIQGNGHGSSARFFVRHRKYRRCTALARIIHVSVKVGFFYFVGKPRYRFVAGTGNFNRGRRIDDCFVGFAVYFAYDYFADFLLGIGEVVSSSAD